MDIHSKNQDILKELFSQMKEEELPTSFRFDVMQQIAREASLAKKRNERWGILAAVLASLVMIGLAIGVCYYIRLPEIKIPPISIPVLSFYLYIGALTLLLLLADYKLRRLLRKDE